ncbi:MAG TPA: class I SAM-dependent methyltransferase [Terriglobales bacterium]|nr:class I SAM-dependent methyltransferase [Terriglobales bacterium]
MTTADGVARGFDRLARPYRWMEYASFGPALARCRYARLGECTAARRALIFGDGDGRFLARLLRAHPMIEIDAVDFSAAMLALQRRRAGAAHNRVRWHRADARAFAPPAGGFDVVVTHFFLDCFDNAELDLLVARVASCCTDGAVWIVSEFAIPNRGWARWPSRAVVAALYRAFGLLTGLPVRRLPDHHAALCRHGFRLEDERRFQGGMLQSQRWRRSDKVGGGAAEQNVALFRLEADVRA